MVPERMLTSVFRFLQGTHLDLQHPAVLHLCNGDIQTLGLEVDIEILTSTEWRARRNAKEFDICHGGWGPDYNDPMTDLDLFESTGGNNHTGYANPEYDALLDAARQEVDPVAREQIFVQLEFMLKEDLPIIPIYWCYEDYAVSEKLVSGYARMPFQGYNLIYTRLAD